MGGTSIEWPPIRRRMAGNSAQSHPLIPGRNRGTAADSRRAARDTAVVSALVAVGPGYRALPLDDKARATGVGWAIEFCVSNRTV